MGIFRGKEGLPLKLPEWYGRKRLAEGDFGDETSNIPEDVFNSRLKAKNRISSSNPFRNVREIDSSKVSDFDFGQFVLPLLRGKEGR